MKRIENYVTKEESQQYVALDNPNSKDNLYDSAIRLVLVKDYFGALDTIDRIIENYGLTSELLLNKAQAHYHLYQYEDALYFIEESLKLDENNTRALEYKAAIEFKLDNLRKYCMVGMYQ